MLLQCIKTLILPRIETDDHEVQGQVQAGLLMSNLNIGLNCRPSSSIKTVIMWYFRVSHKFKVKQALNRFCLAIVKRTNVCIFKVIPSSFLVSQGSAVLIFTWFSFCSLKQFLGQTDIFCDFRCFVRQSQ